MPELVSEGRSGTLLTSDDPGELAERIERVLDDDDVYRHCAAAMPVVRERYSWAAAADEITRLFAPYLQ
jgi:glycosyltransferase involved in cell wall biosynthesis